MIGFDEYETEDLGSHGRFYERLNRFKYDGRSFPRVRHHFWWLLHNCVAHMAIGLAPIAMTFVFHDWTSRKLNHYD